MAMSFTGRTVGMIAVAALGSGWIGALVVNDRAPQQSRVVSRPRPLGSSTPLAPRAAQKLREHRTQAPPPSRGRNPFVYGPRVAPSQLSYRDRTPPVVIAPPPTPPPPPLPVFRLSGIASEIKNGTAMLTAIIIDNGSMVFAKAGDKLSNGYSVVNVEETSVTLIDATGITQTIRLP